MALAAWRWLRRRLFESGGGAFDVDCTDRAAVRRIFEEGHGVLVTDGSRACMEVSHVLYNTVLDEKTGERGGFKQSSDPQDATGSGSRCARYVSPYHPMSPNISRYLSNGWFELCLGTWGRPPF